MKIKIKNPVNDKEFYINIPLKEYNLKNELNSIISYISSLNNRITELEKRVTNLEKYIPMSNTQKTQKSEEENKETSNIIFEGFEKSNILNLEDENQIYNWLDRKPKKFKLLLDSKTDGDSISTFYKKCIFQSPTIVIIETTGGNKFGGYTSIPWKNNKGIIVEDRESFIFSLNKMKKYNNINPENAIQTSDFYFAFGGGSSDFYISNNCHSKNSCYCCKKSKTYDSKENYELNGGKEEFTVLSYEIYKIEE